MKTLAAIAILAATLTVQAPASAHVNAGHCAASVIVTHRTVPTPDLVEHSVTNSSASYGVQGHMNCRWTLYTKCRNPYTGTQYVWHSVFNGVWQWSRIGQNCTTSYPEYVSGWSTLQILVK